MFTIKTELRESVVFAVDTATNRKPSLVGSASTIVDLAPSRRHRWAVAFAPFDQVGSLKSRSTHII